MSYSLFFICTATCCNGSKISEDLLRHVGVSKDKVIHGVIPVHINPSGSSIQSNSLLFLTVHKLSVNTYMYDKTCVLNSTGKQVQCLSLRWDCF